MPLQEHREIRQSFVPDLCTSDAVLRILLVGQMLSGILVLAQNVPVGQLSLQLLVVSLFVHWLSLSCAGVLCPLRSVFSVLSLQRAIVLALVCVQTVALILSECAWQVQVWLESSSPVPVFEHGLFLLRIQIINLLVWIMLLRYFYLQQQWRDQVEASAEAQLQALQARIRPHFLFNSLNSLAALIPVRPEEAETLVENLSELLRVALDHPGSEHALAEEIALTRAYLDIEQLRLGQRLTVNWDVQAADENVTVPVLSLQPLVENAVAHGIELRPEGGEVSIQYQQEEDGFCICVTNPVGNYDVSGHQLAHENIRSRLALIYSHDASLRITEKHGHYQACIRIPRKSISTRP